MKRRRLLAIAPIFVMCSGAAVPAWGNKEGAIEGNGLADLG